MRQNSFSLPNGKICVFVADRSLMSAQLLAHALSQDPRFQITLVSNTGQMMSASEPADVAVVSADFSGTAHETLRMVSVFCERYPSSRLVMLMDSPTREMVVDAFRCGANGVFSRNQPVEDFLKCVDRVSQGDIWASRDEIDHLLSALRGTPVSRMIGCAEISVLTRRELEVAREAGQGRSNKEIAEKLGLSEHTVKNYLFRAFEKIGVSSRVELLFYLLRQEKTSTENEPVADASLLDPNKASEEGAIDAQFALGTAHYYGDGVEKNTSSAYYWLSLTEENASRILFQSRRMLEELRKSMNACEVQEAERSLVGAKLPANKSKSTLNLVQKPQPPRSFAV